MDLFAHRIHRSTYVNGIVRLEFSVLQPDKNGNYDPEADVKPGDESFSVNIPIGGFMRSMGNMRDMMKELSDNGMLPGAEGEGAKQGPGGQRKGMSAKTAKPGKKMRDITKDDDSGEQLV